MRAAIKIIAALFLTLLISKFVSTAGKESKLYRAGEFSHKNLYEAFEDVTFEVKGPDCEGCSVELRYRFRGRELSLPFRYSGGAWRLSFPFLGRGEKIHYWILIKRGEEELRIPEKGDFTLKFKGRVGIVALVLHIFLMFSHMFFACMAFITAVLFMAGYDSGKNLFTYVLLAVTAIIIGGFIVGPYISYKVFDAPWGPYPFGRDVTDTKTLVSFLVWMGAVFYYKLKKPDLRSLSLLTIIATLIDVAIFLIPHSL